MIFFFSSPCLFYYIALCFALTHIVPYYLSSLVHSLLFLFHCSNFFLFSFFPNLILGQVYFIPSTVQIFGHILDPFLPTSVPGVLREYLYFIACVIKITSSRTQWYQTRSCADWQTVYVGTMQFTQNYSINCDVSAE